MRGFGAIAAIVVLVVLAALSAAVVRLGSVVQSGTALDLLGARAQQAAGAGIEWGLSQAFSGGWSNCSNASRTLDLTTDHGVMVTVTCNSRSFSEGEASTGGARNVRIYTLDATACNSNTACPDATRAATETYVERRRQVQATD